jgi:site-specific DNA-methyltransferase (adenine-specific)/site-specific DNA-methyltransferase (cytosine-N4-specific)
MHHGDCLEWLTTLPDKSVDAVVSDPPYPEISRDYGRLTEGEWHTLMRGVVEQSRRVLKPHGSAVFILQPNSERVGRMRPWLWEFMAWTAREWNMVQDAWWWNTSAPPTVHVHRKNGLMRPSVKACVWLGEPDCFRNQDAVLWTETDANVAARAEGRMGLRTMPSGLGMRAGRCASVAAERGGVTPYNILPIANTNSSSSGGSEGHGAATPYPLCHWWVRYLSKPGDLILDPFAGSGTTGVAALRLGRRFAGAEQDATHYATACERLTAEAAGQTLAASRAGQLSLLADPSDAAERMAP